jgi:hypothetical protein
MASLPQFINTDEVHKAFLEAGTDDPANDADNWMREQVALLLEECDLHLVPEIRKVAAKHFPDRPLGLVIVQMLWQLIDNEAAFVAPE